jgi:PIN domain nuclease of toxin-antitoxin system
VAVVVDTYALVWYLNNDRSFSAAATHAIAQAETAGDAVVSVASFIDVWYVSQTTGAVSASEVDQIVRLVRKRGSGFRVAGVTAAVAIEPNRIGRAALPDPWDQLIVATARSSSAASCHEGQAYRQVGPCPDGLVTGGPPTASQWGV